MERVGGEVRFHPKHDQISLTSCPAHLKYVRGKFQDASVNGRLSSKEESGDDET